MANIISRRSILGAGAGMAALAAGGDVYAQTAVQAASGVSASWSR